MIGIIITTIAANVVLATLLFCKSAPMKKYKKIYVCSPLRGDVFRNLNDARGYCAAVAHIPGHMPIASHVFFAPFLDDNRESDRQLGMDYGLELLADCDELWFFGDARHSSGMTAEIRKALELGIPVNDGEREVARFGGV